MQTNDCGDRRDKLPGLGLCGAYMGIRYTIFVGITVPMYKKNKDKKYMKEDYQCWHDSTTYNLILYDSS